MDLTITRREHPGAVFLDLSGRVVFLDTSLREAVRELMNQGHRDFVFDFSGVTHLDSFGMGQLVSIWTSVQNTGGSLKLANPTERVRKLLRITRLDSVFPIEADVSTQ